MALGKTLNSLKDLGCLNPDDYKSVSTNNLRWVCVKCGDEYSRSLTNQKKSTKLCPTCSHAYGLSNCCNKVTTDTLASMGCLNPNEYKNNMAGNLEWLCPTCGNTFTRSYNSAKINNNSCTSCSFKKAGHRQKVSKDTLISMGCLNSEDYVKGNVNNLLWLCPSCNTTYTRSYAGQVVSTKCTACANKEASNKKRVLPTILVKSGVLNPDEYVNAITKNLKYTCDKCGDVITTSYSVVGDKRRTKHFCASCNISVSYHELEVVEFIKSFYKGTIETNIRSVIPPKELDIYLPDLKFAIELNGVYWHTTKHVNRNHHRDKYLACKEKGIKLLQFWDVDWIKKKDLIKSMLRSQIAKDNSRIFARTCRVKELTLDQAKTFLDANHIQGFGTGSSVYLGLYNNETLVSVMCFKKIQDYTYDLSRFCTLQSLTVVGGASKLLKHFIKEYKPVEITSFSDNMYSDGSLYTTLGFTDVARLPADYKYLVGETLQHKFGFRHTHLKSKLEKYDSSLTEKENCANHGLHQIFDSGKIKWYLKVS